MNLVLNILVVIATVLGSGMAFPQARRIVRTRRVDGVSATWIGVSVALNGWWLAYALSTSLWALVAVAFASVVVYSVMAVAYLASVGRAGVPGLAFGALGLGMIPLPFLVVGGWATAGVVVGLSYGIQLTPAVVAACRTRALAGVSAATWSIAWFESAIWLAYGWTIADMALLLAGIVGVVMSTVIIARLAVTGHLVAARPRWTIARISLT